MHGAAFHLLLSARSDNLRGRATIELELIALRRHLAMMKRNLRRPLLWPTDHLFWVRLLRSLPNWRDMLETVKSGTVIGWHRKGFRLYWAWKSRRRRSGHPPIPNDVRSLINRMSCKNPLWGVNGRQDNRPSTGWWTPPSLLAAGRLNANFTTADNNHITSLAGSIPVVGKRGDVRAPLKILLFRASSI